MFECIDPRVTEGSPAYQLSSRGTTFYFADEPDPFRQSGQKAEFEIRMWTVNVGAEFLLLSADGFSFGVDLGGTVGLAIEEKPIHGYSIHGVLFGVERDNSTLGMAGLFAGLTFGKRIEGTPLSARIEGHYRYAPPLSSVFTMDYSGITTALALRCAI